MGNAGLDLDPFVAACKAFSSIDLHSVLTLLSFGYALVVMLHPCLLVVPLVLQMAGFSPLPTPSKNQTGQGADYSRS